MEKVCKKDGSSFCITIPKDCSVPEVPREMTIKSQSREKLWEKGLTAIGQVPDDVKGKRIDLPTYPVFLPWIASNYYAEFRSRVPFKKEIWDDAKKVFDHLNFMHNCNREKGCTSVFVHMRMGDYSRHMAALRWGPDVFQYTNYLQDAFKNVTKTCKNPVFYVLGWTNSDVKEFFSKHEEDFKGMKVVIVAPIQFQMFKSESKNLIGIDLALMAMSDVLVMSYGSYGDFGALFGKDKQMVLYPKNHKTHDETGINLGVPRFVPIPWTEKNDTIH
ncbi:uncharacterized protein LOC142340205 isoform X2 [Convolutriloba macropyga]